MMTENVDDVRRMLAPANPYPSGSLAGAGQDQTGHAAYLRVTRGGRRATRRTAVRIGVVGALAASIAAGVTVVQGLGGVDDQGRPRPVVPGLPPGPAANAQVVLGKVADAAQGRASVGPKPGQWTYEETRGTLPVRKDVQSPKTPMKTRVDRVWVRGDGTRLATFEKGRLVESPTGGPTVMPPSSYAALTALPRDPAKLLAWAYQQRAPLEKNDGAFKLLTSIIANNAVLPPAQEAATYRALAMIPGVEVDRNAVDPQGRPALAVSRVAEGWVRESIMLDRATFAYRGFRDVAVKEHHDDQMKIAKGTVMAVGLRIKSGVVDKPGQLPH
ncbi:CU044_5270 family protein [Actinomadura barringtoniae]|uniref:CU044_5270 family protein n=1 Tax=Actinomadura barringtoniae TaxID=1427535 RepID=A0A939T707_9ACTN|nr:CU044_5270 family protein [Actinomadura barringtoniae]MBO2455556.1 CU044_5270 family protein [Actinomadura barringtoniae]